MNNIIQGAQTLLEEMLRQLPLVGVAIFILLVTWIAATIASKVTASAFERSGLRRSLVNLFTRLIRIGIWLCGVLIAAMIAIPGLTPSGFIAALGLATVAVGFAFKDIFENLLAGILMMVREPFKLGDFIECEDIDGKVETINIRDTCIRQGDGQLIVVPNAILYKNPIKVRTDLERRRVSLFCGVGYGEDIDRCREIIRQAVEEIESVDKERPIDVLASSFGASSVDYEIRWWTKPTPGDLKRSVDAVIPAVKKALEAEGVEIPFPYRTLTFAEPLETRTDHSAGSGSGE